MVWHSSYLCRFFHQVRGDEQKPGNVFYFPADTPGTRLDCSRSLHKKITLQRVQIIFAKVGI